MQTIDHIPPNPFVVRDTTATAKDTTAAAIGFFFNAYRFYLIVLYIYPIYVRNILIVFSITDIFIDIFNLFLLFIVSPISLLKAKYLDT